MRGISKVIAEIHGKISSKGTNLHERLEDNLTSDVFGALRYMSFNKGMKSILNKVLGDDLLCDDIEEWANYFEFWPYHLEGELDCLLNLPSATIGIEVKYTSGLSSEDQLKRESNIINEFAKENGNKGVLIFIANESYCREVYEYTKRGKQLNENVEFKYISWEDILEIIIKIQKSNKLNGFEHIILSDIEMLLKRKGFEKFKEFNKDVNVDKDKYYEFNCRNNNFKWDAINIRGEEYYEFRR